MKRPHRHKPRPPRPFVIEERTDKPRPGKRSLNMAAHKLPATGRTS